MPCYRRVLPLANLEVKEEKAVAVDSRRGAQGIPLHFYLFSDIELVQQ
jgi:hypothetical protein